MFIFYFMICFLISYTLPFLFFFPIFLHLDPYFEILWKTKQGRKFTMKSASEENYSIIQKFIYPCLVIWISLLLLFQLPRCYFQPLLRMNLSPIPIIEHWDRLKIPLSKNLWDFPLVWPVLLWVFPLFWPGLGCGLSYLQKSVNIAKLIISSFNQMSESSIDSPRVCWLFCC